MHATATQDEQTPVDVAVIGGGVAGLTAAIALCRFRRSVVVIDSGRPRNAAADGLHNFLTRDGMDPLQLLAIGRDELTGFGGRLLSDVAVGAERCADRVVVRLQSGATVTARRLIVASGTTDVLPSVAGLADRWGRDVVHCPYCHGWEVRDRRLGVLATNPAAAVHQALLFAELTDDIRVFAHTAEPFTAEQRAQLAARDNGLVNGEVASVIVADDHITGVRMSDGGREPVEGLIVATGLQTRSAVLDDLGVARETDGLGGYVADAGGATSAPGIWAAGNIKDPYAPLVIAAAAGMTAAGEVNGDLVAERARLALSA